MVLVPEEAGPRRREPVSVFDLIQAVSVLLKRFNERDDVREIQADPFTVSEKMAELRVLLEERGRFRFSELFASARSRSEVVVTFLALLELTRLHQLRLSQTDDFSEIEIEPMGAALPIDADTAPADTAPAIPPPPDGVSPET